MQSDKIEPRASRGIFRFTAIGTVAGVAWALVNSAVVGLVIPIAAALLVFPICEEAIRFAALSATKKLGQSGVHSGTAFGAGFGLVEAVLRWWDATGAAASTILSFVAPVAPLILHIMLGSVAWWFIQSNKVMRGFALCLLLHILHNAIVVEVIASQPTFMAALAMVGIQVVVYAAIALEVLRRTNPKPKSG